MYKHLFKASLTWISREKSENSKVKVYTKSHEIKIEDKELLKISSAKAFKGDPSLLNPEDLLLSAITSCHMMSYLFVCQKNNIEILSYHDNSEAILEMNSDGSGRITKVILNPKVIINDNSKKELALSLHIRANQLCFIANSCNFEVIHHSIVETL